MDSYSDHYSSSSISSILLDDTIMLDANDNTNNNNDSIPPSPPTVMIPATTNCTKTTTTTTAAANGTGVSVVGHLNLAVGSSVAAACNNNINNNINNNNTIPWKELVTSIANINLNNNYSHVNNSGAYAAIGGGVAGSTSPRTPKLVLDHNSFCDAWQQLQLVLDTNSNNNNVAGNSNLDQIEIEELVNSLTSHNNTTTLADINNLDTHIDHLMMVQSSNNNNEGSSSNTGTTQGYLGGSILVNGTPICLQQQQQQQNNCQFLHQHHQHSRSPSMGSLNTSCRGIKKPNHHSRSSSCLQQTLQQSYMNHGGQLTGCNNNFMNVSGSCNITAVGGLNSPSVTSTCSSQTMSPANVSTSSFNSSSNNNGLMMNNGAVVVGGNQHQQQYGWLSNNNIGTSCSNNNNANQQYYGSPIVNNQQGVNGSLMSAPNSKKGKIPGHRRDKLSVNTTATTGNNSSTATLLAAAFAGHSNQHGKGLLVEANPNDRKIKMKQNKVNDGGFKVLMEDGITKKKKDTSLQFHTCTFQQ